MVRVNFSCNICIIFYLIVYFLKIIVDFFFFLENEKFKIIDKSYKRILKSIRIMFIDFEIKWKENDINIEDI